MNCPVLPFIVLGLADCVEEIETSVFSVAATDGSSQSPPWEHRSDAARKGMMPLGCTAVEGLEVTARLALLMRGHNVRALTPDQIAKLVTAFDVEWDD